MEIYELSFVKIVILRDDIAEVIVNDGVEVDSMMVGEYQDFLLSHLRNPFAILVNKINTYTFDFEAQMKFNSFKGINAAAVVAYTPTTKLVTETVISVTEMDSKWNMKIFSDREEALAWLISMQEKI